MNRQKLLDIATIIVGISAIIASVLHFTKSISLNSDLGFMLNGILIMFLGLNKIKSHKILGYSLFSLGTLLTLDYIVHIFNIF